MKIKFDDFFVVKGGFKCFAVDFEQRQDLKNNDYFFIGCESTDDFRDNLGFVIYPNDYKNSYFYRNSAKSYIKQETHKIIYDNIQKTLSNKEKVAI